MLNNFRDSNVLFITFSDQGNWGLNRNNRLGLNCTTDFDENWRPLFTRYFSHLLCYDMRKQANSLGIAAANDELMALVEVYRPRLIIYPCVFDGLVTLASLAAMRQNGSSIAGFFFDDDIFFEQYTKYLLPYMDYFVTASPTAGSYYREYGIAAVMVNPVPMNTAIFCRLPHLEQCFDITFVGNPHTADRQPWLDKFEQHGIMVKTFGGTGAQTKIHYSRMVEIFNQSKINLNFSRHVTPQGTLVPQFKGRIFEVTLSGGFLLCEYLPGIEKFFIPDKEIVCFRDINEAVTKIIYYLEHDNEREAIAAAGQQRAWQDYRGDVVVNKIFDQISTLPPVPLDQNSPLAQLPNNLSKLYAAHYCRWANALLTAPYPLRRQWRATAELALHADPDNRPARQLILFCRLFTDPRPLTAFFQKTAWLIENYCPAQYRRCRKKIRQFKSKLKGHHA